MEEEMDPALPPGSFSGCQGGKHEIPYISDGSVSWDAVEKAEIYGGGCAVPPTGTISGENGLEELVEAALETEGYRLLPEKEWLEGTMDLWVRFDNGVVIGLYQDVNYGYIGTELDVIGEGPFYSFPEKFYDLAFQAKEQQSADQ